jgi:anti-anti-sigma regulatory factor
MVVLMATIPVRLKIDAARVVEALQEAGEKLEGVEGGVVLDFSSVPRIDTSALRAMEEFVDIADQKGIKVGLRGISVNVYKVLKLVRLASRFSFVTDTRNGLATMCRQ